MTQNVSNFQYRLMADVGMPVRNIFLNPKKMLAEVTVLPGEKVLDYGCGPGNFTFLLADRVGKDGIVYALDVHPLALQRVEQGKRAGGQYNVRTILSDCATYLPDGELDRVLCFDVFHLLQDPQGVLRELHRSLKPDGVLYVNDHHMKDEDILAGVAAPGLFALRNHAGKTYQFVKA